MRLLLTAMNCPKGALDANTRAHAGIVADAASAGARLAVFPELSLTGSVDPLHWPDRAIAVADDAVGAVVDATGRHDVAAVFGIAEAAGDAVYITQVLADRGRLVSTYRKRFLGEGEECYRAGAAAPRAQWAVDGRPVGICICAESAHDAPFDDAVAAGASTVLFCAAPGLYGRRTDAAGWQAGYDWWSGSALGDAQRQARRCGLWIAISTQAGATADEDFPGLAGLVDPTGAVVEALPDERAGTVLVDIPD